MGVDPEAARYDLQVNVTDTRELVELIREITNKVYEVRVEF